MNSASSNAALFLADGTVWSGSLVGEISESSGEVVFTTAYTGYQEICTDPSFAGQIITFTTPHIGNVGTNHEDVESTRAHCAGVITHALQETPSSWRARTSFPEFLRAHNIPALTGVDTRALTRHLRSSGVVPGLIARCDTENARSNLITRAAALPTMHGQELVSRVTSAKARDFTQPLWEKPAPPARARVAVLDYGVKQNILRALVSYGATVRVFPAKTEAAKILAWNPAGIVLSNGPGDPSAVTYALPAIQALLGARPLLGICLGYQLLALAIGAKTFKLPYGHRGANQPVQDVETKRVLITSQNHGFAVDPQSLPARARVTHVNLNDRTLEGFAIPDAQVIAVQYHPEAAPGPHDARTIFSEFMDGL